jgi:hypothetical protein
MTINHYHINNQNSLFYYIPVTITVQPSSYHANVQPAAYPPNVQATYAANVQTAYSSNVQAAYPPVRPSLQLAHLIDSPAHPLQTKAWMLEHTEEAAKLIQQKGLALINSPVIKGLPKAWKTALCRNIGKCTNIDCSFAHSITTVAAINFYRNKNYKVSPCEETETPHPEDSCPNFHPGGLRHVRGNGKAPGYWTICPIYYDSLLAEAGLAHQKPDAYSKPKL